MVSTRVRTISGVTRDRRDTSECDSHADTHCAGSNTKIVYTTDQVARVSAYDGKEDSRLVKIGTAATIYEDPESAKRYCLMLHQALLMGDRMSHTLLSTNQMRASGLRVEDAPCHFEEHADSKHAIFGKILGEEDGDWIQLSLELEGTTSYLHTRAPTDDEVDGDGSSVYPVIHLSDEQTWDPSSMKFCDRERSAKRRRGPTGIYSGTSRSLQDVSTDQVDINLLRSGPSIEFEVSNESLIFDLDSFTRDIASLATSYDIVVLDETDPDFRKNPDFQYSSEGDDTDQHAGSKTRNDSHWSGSKRSRDVFETNSSRIARIHSSGRRDKVTPEELSKRWGIGLQTAIRTLKTTTQRGIRTHPLNLEKRVRTWNHHLKVHANRCSVFTDTMFASVKSVGGKKMAQVFVTEFGFIDFYPMKSRSESGHMLEKHIRRYGIPMVLVSDGAAEEKDAVMLQVSKLYHVDRALTEPYSAWQNLAESAINTLKKGISRTLRSRGAPRKLWSWAGVWVGGVRCVIAGTSDKLQGRTPMEIMTGRQPDISEYLQFDFYQLVYWIDDGEKDWELRKKVGRVIGIAHEVGQAMVFWVLTDKAKAVARSSVTAISEDEKRVDGVAKLIREYDGKIQDKIGDDKAFDPELNLHDPNGDLLEILQDEWSGDKYDPFDPELDSSRATPEENDYSPEELDKLVGAQLKRFDGSKDLRGTVKARLRDEDGKPVGKQNNNPFLDTREWVIDWSDGAESVLSHNIVADSIYSIVDVEGRETLLFKEIVDHKKGPGALSGEEGTFTSPNGRKSWKWTTAGWWLLVLWMDGSTSWERLKDMKESYPVHAAEYAIAHKLDHEPAFRWWIKTVLKHRDRIVAKAKSTRYWKKTHKFGIEIPKNVKEALELDKQNRNDLWKLAIEKEYKNVAVAFAEVEDPLTELVGYKELHIHFIFDVKMDFTRKARLVGDGSRIELPAETAYSSVPARDSVRILFLLAALNDVDIKAADIQNAYLTAQPIEKCFVIADGKVFGQRLHGKKLKIVRALYGMPGSGRAFRNLLSDFIQKLGFVPTRGDPDVYRKPAMKTNGERYYEYFIAYVDDIMCISECASEIMEQVKATFKFKNDKCGDPDIYLGSSIKRFEIDDVDPVKTWALSSDKYVSNALKELNRKLVGRGRALMTGKLSCVMATGYRPELDQSPELSTDDHTWYQEMIGVLRWAVELGRLDIYNAVTLLASQMASPREGHLEALLRIFAWLQKHDRSSLVADPMIPPIDFAQFRECDWTDFYPGAKETLPPGKDFPEALGRSVVISCYVDADHAGDRVTRRSHTGIIIFVNNMPILWHSKKQSTVESSTFGSEYIALRQATEMIEGLRYKLRTFGVPLDGPAYTFCDNQSVVSNSTRPESPLKKKHCAVAYHRVREACAAGTIIITHVKSEENLADLLTKPLPGQKILDLMYHIAW